MSHCYIKDTVKKTYIKTSFINPFSYNSWSKLKLLLCPHTCMYDHYSTTKHKHKWLRPQVLRLSFRLLHLSALGHFHFNCNPVQILTSLWLVHALSRGVKKACWRWIEASLFNRGVLVSLAAMLSSSWRSKSWGFPAEVTDGVGV